MNGFFGHRLNTQRCKGDQKGMMMILTRSVRLMNDQNDCDGDKTDDNVAGEKDRTGE